MILNTKLNQQQQKNKKEHIPVIHSDISYVHRECTDSWAILSFSYFEILGKL